MTKAKDILEYKINGYLRGLFHTELKEKLDSALDQLYEEAIVENPSAYFRPREDYRIVLIKGLEIQEKT